MSVGGTPPAKYAESIPAVTAPVKLPKLTPSLARDRSGLITGGATGVLALVLLCIGIVVSL